LFFGYPFNGKLHRFRKNLFTRKSRFQKFRVFLLVNLNDISDFHKYITNQ
jgi:hypothetical protein